MDSPFSLPDMTEEEWKLQVLALEQSYTALMEMPLFANMFEVETFVARLSSHFETARALGLEIRP